MKKLIGIKRKREKSCFFPEKLFKILQNKHNQSLIHWDEEGKVVVIENKFDFSKITEKYFKGQNYDSFVRQLNLYGFEKLINLQKSDKECFRLENFTKNSNINDIKQIKRKTKNISTSKEDSDIIESNKKIDDILNKIENDKNDFNIIEKYKSIINDEKISINSNFIQSVVDFIIKKKEELKIKTNGQYIELLHLNFNLKGEPIIKNERTGKFNLNNSIIQNKNEFDFQVPLNLTISKSFDNYNKKDNMDNKEILKYSLFSNESEIPDFLKN